MFFVTTGAWGFYFTLLWSPLIIYYSLLISSLLFHSFMFSNRGYSAILTWCVSSCFIFIDDSKEPFKFILGSYFEVDSSKSRSSRSSATKALSKGSSSNSYLSILILNIIDIWVAFTKLNEKSRPINWALKYQLN